MTRRFGNKGDGGYDVCVWPRSARPKPRQCLVYSFGSAVYTRRYFAYSSWVKMLWGGQEVAIFGKIDR